MRLFARFGANFLAYARLARWNNYTGWILLLWPCLWGATTSVMVTTPEDMLQYNLQPLSWTVNLTILTVAFSVAAFLSRSTGCVWNDLLDRNIDARIARTRNRPMAIKQVSLLGGAVFAVFLLLSTLLWTFIVLPLQTLLTALVALPLVIAYPLIKRTKLWPQIFLAFTFSWGVWIGWVSGSNMLTPFTELFFDGRFLAPLVLYLSTAAWVTGYDTIYAMQDAHEDRVLGISSLAVSFIGSKAPVVIFYGIAMLGILGFFFLSHLYPYSALLLPAFLHMLYQLWRLDPLDASLCGKIFRSNVITGGLLWLAMLGSVLLYSGFEAADILYIL